MILSLALLDLLFVSSSSLLGSIVFKTLYFGKYSSGITGKCFKFGSIELTLLNKSLHILSSNEWNVITHILPPIVIRSNESLRLFSNTFNSSFTSMRIAWNIFLAGCFSLLYFSGTLRFITSTSSKVVFIGLELTIPLAILLEYFYSPYLWNISINLSSE